LQLDLGLRLGQLLLLHLDLGRLLLLLLLLLAPREMERPPQVPLLLLLVVVVVQVSKVVQLPVQQDLD
jgi:hypothetical protein